MSFAYLHGRNSTFDRLSVVCVFERNPTNYVCAVLHAYIYILYLGVIHTNYMITESLVSELTI